MAASTSRRRPPPAHQRRDPRCPTSRKTNVGRRRPGVSSARDARSAAATKPPPRSTPPRLDKDFIAGTFPTYDVPRRLHAPVLIHKAEERG